MHNNTTVTDAKLLTWLSTMQNRELKRCSVGPPEPELFRRRKKNAFRTATGNDIRSLGWINLLQMLRTSKFVNIWWWLLQWKLLWDSLEPSLHLQSQTSIVIPVSQRYIRDLIQKNSRPGNHTFEIWAAKNPVCSNETQICNNTDFRDR